MRWSGRSLGTSKHRTMGHPTKSPRARLLDRLDAERDERKSTRLPDQSVTELFGIARKKRRA